MPRRLGRGVREYFRVPSMTGFSAYRSGGILVHTIVSGAVMLAAYLVADRLFGAPFWQGALGAVVCATLSWGLGRKLGEERAAMVPLALAALLGAFFYLPFAIAVGAAAILNGMLSFILPKIIRDGAYAAQDALEDAAAAIAAAKQEGPARFSLRDRGLRALPPGLEQLEGLRELELDGNRLSELPVAVKSLRGLRRLSIADNRDITSLPAWIGQLGGLEAIDASRCGLVAVPREIGALHGLCKLVLEDNRIRALPREMAQLASLIELDLRRNPIGEAELRSLRAALPVARIQSSPPKALERPV